MLWNVLLLHGELRHRTSVWEGIQFNLYSAHVEKKESLKQISVIYKWAPIKLKVLDGFGLLCM